MGKIEIKTFTDNEWLEYIDDLAALEIEVFRSYPYLYDVSLEYERAYLKTYAESEQSGMIIAFDGSKVIGASTCIPMVEVEDEVKKPFEESEYPIQKVLYLGESVLLKKYRKRGIGVAFYEHREQHAQYLNMDMTAFCCIIRPENHPLKPEGYRPLDKFWIKRGYRKQPEMKATMVWKDVHQEEESKKKLVFWTKDLQRENTRLCSNIEHTSNIPVNANQMLPE
jgi:GNAT superfamily N-acetyltransferase